jgi:GT2 family glycosyltransferase
MGDYDYGLRARAAGCSVWIAPGMVGTCAPNPARRPGEEPFLQEWRRLWSTKELLPGPWAVFSRRWAGRLWPVYWLSPYLRAGFRLLRGRIRGRRTPAGAS